MFRFLLGLALGGVGSGITWAITGPTHWVWVIGLSAAGLIWFGELILDDLT